MEEKLHDRIINAVKKHAVIYDVQHPHYGKRGARTLAFKKVCAEVDSGIDEFTIVKPNN